MAISPLLSAAVCQGHFDKMCCWVLFKILFIYLRGREGKLPSAGSFHKCLYKAMSGLGPKPGTGNSIQVPTRVPETQTTWSIMAASQGVHWSETGVGNLNQHFGMGQEPLNQQAKRTALLLGSSNLDQSYFHMRITFRPLPCRQFKAWLHTDQPFSQPAFPGPRRRDICKITGHFYC